MQIAHAATGREMLCSRRRRRRRAEWGERR
jgi:hypothetical protein